MDQALSNAAEADARHLSTGLAVGDGQQDDAQDDTVNYIGRKTDRFQQSHHQRERGESLIRAVRDRVDTDVARAKEYSSRAHMRLRQHERERGESLIRAVKDRLGLPGGGTLG